MGMSKDAETDEIKKVFLEGNPVFLVGVLGTSGIGELWGLWGLWGLWSTVNAPGNTNIIAVHVYGNAVLWGAVPLWCWVYHHPHTVTFATPSLPHTLPHPLTILSPSSLSHTHEQGLTMIVSLLHSIFDMFAFKNDIGFWKNKENLTGLSVRTILINCFCQLIIFLYLLDSETSFVVLASSFVGTLIEFWKVFVYVFFCVYVSYDMFCVYVSYDMFCV